MPTHRKRPFTPAASACAGRGSSRGSGGRRTCGCRRRRSSRPALRAGDRREPERSGRGSRATAPSWIWNGRAAEYHDRYCRSGLPPERAPDVPMPIGAQHRVRIEAGVVPLLPAPLVAKAGRSLKQARMSIAFDEAAGHAARFACSACPVLRTAFRGGPAGIGQDERGAPRRRCRPHALGIRNHAARCCCSPRCNTHVFQGRDLHAVGRWSGAAAGSGDPPVAHSSVG